MAEETIQNIFLQNPVTGSNPPGAKKKRNLPGTPDPEAEVIALSPKTLMATNRFLCEICGKGFQRDQNLQLHRRGHNLPWKLKQRSSKEPKKRVYVCPEKSCIHNHPSRALGDLTGIKKHFCRKHGEKKWKCEKCSKKYAVQSDWKAHSKTCGTREYKCDCGTLFSRRDSFITHRAFCDALAEETARVTAASNIAKVTANNLSYHFIGTSLGPTIAQHFPPIFKPVNDPIDQSRQAGLSLWMGNGTNGPEAMCSNAAYADASSDYNVNWAFGNKNALNSDEELTSTSSLPLSSNTKEFDGSRLVTVPSLYSTQNNFHESNSVNMSATALLQKAAQIGATSTDPAFLGNFGLKIHNNQVQNGNRYCGLYGSNLVMDTNLGGQVDNSTDDFDTSNQLQMYPSKRRILHNEESAGGQTRDFLGVGVAAICHPSSINGWI